MTWLSHFLEFLKYYSALQISRLEFDFFIEHISKSSVTAILGIPVWEILPLIYSLITKTQHAFLLQTPKQLIGSATFEGIWDNVLFIHISIFKA